MMASFPSTLKQVVISSSFKQGSCVDKKNLVTLSNSTSWGFIMHLHIDYNFKYSTTFLYELFHHAQHLFKIIKTPNINCDVNLQNFVTIILFPLAKT